MQDQRNQDQHEQNQQNEIDKVDSCFEFEIYSKNSIVKSYDLSLGCRSYVS